MVDKDPLVGKPDSLKTEANSYERLLELGFSDEEIEEAANQNGSYPAGYDALLASAIDTTEESPLVSAEEDSADIATAPKKVDSPDIPMFDDIEDTYKAVETDRDGYPMRYFMNSATRKVYTTDDIDTHAETRMRGASFSAAMDDLGIGLEDEVDRSGEPTERALEAAAAKKAAAKNMGRAAVGRRRGRRRY
ncbi:hypothetical protein HGB25_03195 [Candidatus Saccharibacteria bacterium]|nr:hypothetical protein [Candidatus Saccharibacteria bacterium]